MVRPAALGSEQRLQGHVVESTSLYEWCDLLNDLFNVILVLQSIDILVWSRNKIVVEFVERSLLDMVYARLACE